MLKFGCLGCLGVLAVGAVLLVLGTMAATHPYRTLGPVTISAANAASAQGKADSLQAAAGRARSSGRPVPVDVTFSDDELSSLAGRRMAALPDPPLDQVVLHATDAGYLEGTARAHAAGQSLPVYLKLRVAVDGGRPSLALVDSRMGTMGMPGPLADQVNHALQQASLLGGSGAASDLSVRVTRGAVHITGTVQPG